MTAALYNSGWVGSGFQGRLTAEIDDLNFYDDKVDVTIRWHAEFSASVSDSANDLTTGGSWPATSGSISVNGKSAWNVRVQTITVPSNGQTLAITGTLSGIGAIGEETQLTVNTSLVLPTSPPRRPRKVTSFTLTPVGGTSPTGFTLNWTADVTTYRPVTSWYIDRWDGSRWLEPLVSVGGAVRTYTDTSVAPDKYYSYRITALGLGGRSEEEYVYPGHFRTKPNRPSRVVATKSGSNVVITWLNTSATAKRYRVWRAVNTVLDSTPLGTTSSKSWTVADPGTAASYTYYVEAMAYRDDGTYSTYVYSDKSDPSNPVGGPAAPFAPVVLAPIGATLDASASISATWVHRPGDGAPQSAYEVRYREVVPVGQAVPEWSTTGRITSTASEHVFAGSTFAAGKTYEWQVRTWATHADSSPWSASGTLLAALRPAATFTGPAATITTDRVTPVWSTTASGGATQATYACVLYDAGGAAVASLSGSGTASSQMVDFRLDNNATYTLKLIVADSNGLTSPIVTRDFAVDFIEPAPAEVVHSWDPGLGSVALTFTNPTLEGVTPAYNVLSRWDGLQWVEIAHPAVDSTYVDQVPMSSPENRYKVRTVSTLGAAADVEVTVPTPNYADWFWVNYGPGWTGRARARYSPKTSSKRSRANSKHYFAGRSKPVLFTSNEVSYTISVDCVIEESDPLGNRAAWEAAVLAGGTLCYRDPLGRRALCDIEDVGFKDESLDTTRLSFTLDEVDYSERP